MRHILHIDDDENDLLLVRRAFQRAAVPVVIDTAHDGQGAITFFEQAGVPSESAERPLPDVVLLDLKMTGVDGFDVLAFLQSHERLRRIPVYMLTSSGQRKDRERALALGATGYFEKTPGFEDVVSAVADLIGMRGMSRAGADMPSVTIEGFLNGGLGQVFRPAKP